VSGKWEAGLRTSPDGGYPLAGHTLKSKCRGDGNTKETFCEVHTGIEPIRPGRGLIKQNDGGDRDTAARRLGIAPDRLAGLLSGDWRRFSLDALAALVQGYSVTMDSLLATPESEMKR
jgi:hypothetical protein